MIVLSILGLFAAAVAGIAVRFVLEWNSSNNFTLRQNLKQIIAAATVVLPVAVVFHFLGFKHWMFYILIAGAGFLTKYIVEKATKIKG